MAANMLARMIIPVVALANPMKDFIGDDSQSTTSSCSPRDLAQIGAVNKMCDPRTLILMRRQIQHLASDIHVVQISFTNMIASIKSLDELKMYRRYQCRHVIRELPRVIELSEHFKQIVLESREEAASAQVVISSFHHTVLKNLQKSSQQALKAEVDAIAKAIARHELKAQDLGDKFSSLSQSIAQVSETIKRCIRKEQEKADLRIVDLGLQVHKLGSDISSCKESRSVFSNSLQGVGQHCIGLLSAAFGYAPFENEAGIKDPDLISQPPKRSSSAPDLQFDGAREPDSALDDRPVRLAYQEAANLGRIAAKVAGMGQLWSALHMELHKISTWLDAKFVDGKMQGSWELYEVNVANIQGPTEELIIQLDRYAKHAFFA